MAAKLTGDKRQQHEDHVGQRDAREPAGGGAAGAGGGTAGRSGWRGTLPAAATATTTTADRIRLRPSPGGG
jgi:hypothetical protein